MKILRPLKDGYFEDNPKILPMLDSLLGDKDFYLTLLHTAEWLRNEDEDTKDYTDFKAMQVMQSYLSELLSRDFSGKTE